MSYKVIEDGGNWSVCRDSVDLHFEGGTEITYELYKEIKDKPDKAELYFDKVNGQLRQRKVPKLAKDKP